MNNNVTKIILASIASITILGVSYNLSNQPTQVVKENGIVKETQITLDEAKQSALNKVKGTIEKTTQDEDDYIVYVNDGTSLYELEVDKLTGSVTEIDKKAVKVEEEKSIASTTQATKSSSLQKASSNITLAKAKEVALKEVSGTVQKTSQDDDDYNIYIKNGNYVYEIEVDKRTGKVDSVEKEKIKTTTSSSTKTSTSNSVKTTLEKAKTLALAEVNGKIISTKTDDDDYEIIIQKGDYLYEVEVDRRTGRIDNIDKERVKSSVSTISATKAKEIALKQVNGTVTSVDYDDDDYQYDVEVRDGQVEYEVKIDARNGNVIRVEKDD